MKTQDELDRQLATMLRESLDRELGPDPTWAESPAAVRVAQLDRRRRWPLRVLAVAALIGVGGGAALLAGAPKPPPEPANGWIAYTVAQEDPAGADLELDIWFLALDQEPRRVVGTDSDAVDQLCPAFAPDGRSLAYGSVEGSGWWQGDAAPAPYRNAALVVADVADDGTVSDRLTIDVGDGLPPPCPVWSPNGDQVAFGVPRTSSINPTRSGEGSEVWVVRLSDRSVSVVPDLLATDLDWSPDGSLLAIVGGVETASGEGVRDGLQDARIHLYAPSSDTIRSLDDTLGASSLTWSPDDGRIAYAIFEPVSVDPGRQVLRILDVETGRQEVITRAYSAIHGVGPVWSPDGERIVYQRMVRSERHEVVILTPGDRSQETGLAREVVIPPDDIDTGLFPWRVTWSPDSKYLLYRAWSYPNGYPSACCGKEFVEQQSWVAVPADLDGPSVVLTDTDAGLAYDSPDTMRVPIQIWGRR
jgi:Tol biopolymer transport system component